MNIFQEIKALFAVKSFVEEIEQEAKMDTASGKAGYRSTEFWFSVAAQIGTLWGAMQGFVPPKWAAIIATAGAALYTVARTVAKAVSDIQVAKASSTTVTTTQPATVVTTPAQ